KSSDSGKTASVSEKPVILRQNGVILTQYFVKPNGVILTQYFVKPNGVILTKNFVKPNGVILTQNFVKPNGVILSRTLLEKKLSELDDGMRKSSVEIQIGLQHNNHLQHILRY